MASGARVADRLTTWIDRALARLLRPTWPPVAALVVAATVFLAILRTESGLSALPVFFLAPPSGLAVMPHAYTLGAAGSLALAALVLVALVGAMLDLVARAAWSGLVRRTRRR